MKKLGEYEEDSNCSLKLTLRVEDETLKGKRRSIRLCNSLSGDIFA